MVSFAHNRAMCRKQQKVFVDEMVNVDRMKMGVFSSKKLIRVAAGEEAQGKKQPKQKLKEIAGFEMKIIDDPL